VEWDSTVCLPHSVAEIVGRDFVISITTRYGLDGPVIEPLFGARFYTAVQTGPWGPPIFLRSEYQVFFPGVQRPRRDVYHPPPSRAEVKERVVIPSKPRQGHRCLFWFELFPFISSTIH